MIKRFPAAAAAAAFVLGTAFGAAFVSGPSHAQAGPRVFEIRTYTTHPGKLEALNARFRNHTLKLFEKHGMTNVGYWTPRDSARAQNTIVYLLAYPSREAARASWQAFGRDPEWRQAAAASEANGKIVEKVESVFLDPTDFSPMK